MRRHSPSNSHTAGRWCMSASDPAAIQSALPRVCRRLNNGLNKPASPLPIMTPTFWRAIDAIGSTPVAALTWRKALGTDEPGVRPLLRRTRTHASTLVDPDASHYCLDVYPEGDAGFLATGDHRPPLPIEPEDLVETMPSVNALR